MCSAPTAPPGYSPAHRGSGRRQGARIPVEQRQAGALGGKALGRRQADAAGGAGDEDELAVEAHGAPYSAFLGAPVVASACTGCGAAKSNAGQSSSSASGTCRHTLWVGSTSVQSRIRSR